MTSTIFFVLIIISLLLISKKLAASVIKKVFQVISILSSVIVLYKNREVIFEFTNKFFLQLIPYLFNQTINLVTSIFRYAINYSEQVFNYLIK